MFLFYIFLFLACCIVFYFTGEQVIECLMKITRFLGWREFVVAFFVMAFSASLPNLFVGITSALHKIPELSFGDVAGNNLAALTVAVALAVFFARGNKIPAESRMVQTTSIFTMIAAVLPLILSFNGMLSRTDGIILIGFFLFYMGWLFSKKERFTKIYDDYQGKIEKEFKSFMKNLGKALLGISLLILSAQGIVFSARFFAESFNVSLILIGVLVTGIGSALPEIYFSVISARRGETWMILGNLMGAVIIPATLVLGIVALIHPIQIIDSASFVVARFFLIISAIFFFVVVRTGKQINRKEALFLLGIFIAFIIVEILIKL